VFASRLGRWLRAVADLVKFVRPFHHEGTKATKDSRSARHASHAAWEEFEDSGWGGAPSPPRAPPTRHAPILRTCRSPSWPSCLRG